ncbi:uncharacterized protein si:ch211-10d23.5 [Engraulis encrasicolus]|uniref:uncharacterized protein si:ch211-10d23.5 n=1 Tax=Engraulis encrasicolus TaxID=184585 RepID=UPI002FD785A4
MYAYKPSGEQPAVVCQTAGTVESPHCPVSLSSASNLKRHERTQHGHDHPPVICVDKKNAIFVTPKDASGPCIPIHIMKSVVTPKLACESAICRDYMKIAAEFGSPGQECQNVRRTNGTAIYSAPPSLLMASLDEMVGQGLFSTLRQRECEELHSKAQWEEVDCVFPIVWKRQRQQERLKHFSVYTGQQESWCPFGRTRVTFDSQHVLVADGNWKIAFDVPVLFKRPNRDNLTEEDMEVNVRGRWNSDY